jgi:AbiV family abortive infection protein
VKTRQFHRLAGEPRDRFYALLAEGLTSIAEHCLHLDSAARTLAAGGDTRSAFVLDTLAREEAGKYLVLLDVARAGRRDQARLSTQLKRAGDHLAKGLYAAVARIRPGDYAELLRFLESKRREWYLEGPNDVDWVFPNEILTGRDEALYVDLVENDGDLAWLSPSRFDVLEGFSSPSAVELVRSLEAAGLSEGAALRIISEVWQSFAPEPKTRWEDLGKLVETTVDRVQAAGLLPAEFSPDDYSLIYEAWTFPMHSTDLVAVPVEMEALLDRRRTAFERQRRDWYGF